MNNDISIQKIGSLPLGNLDAFIRYANSLPMLSAKEEHALALSLQQTGDLEAAKKLVVAHLRYVIKVAKGYNGYGLPLGDLIQEGNIGLMKAVKKFDPDHGVRLVSFAVHWIKAEIHEFIIKNWKIVKIATTKAQRKLFFNLRSMKSRLGWFTNEEINTVATDLGVKPHEVVAMEQRLNSTDDAFDTTNGEEENGTQAYLSPVSYLTSATEEPSTALEKSQTSNNSMHNLHVALEKIDARGKAILERRWLQEKKSTLHELAKEFAVSPERIRQLEKKALNELQEFISALS